MQFTLRPWNKLDAESLAKYANNSNIACWLTDMFPHPYSIDDAKSYIALAEANPQTLLVIDVEGEAVGSIGIFPERDIHRLNAEMGYWLAEEFWGHGIMPEAVKRMVKHTFDNFDIERIFARPFHTNIKSQNVLKKAGFEFEARLEKVLIKNDELLDELIYAIRRN